MSRKERRTRKYNLAVEKGLPSNLAIKIRDWSDEKFQAEINRYQRELMVKEYGARNDEAEHLSRLEGKEYQKEIKRLERNFQARERYRLAGELGASTEDKKRARNSPKYFEELESQLKGFPQLLIFWEDKADQLTGDALKKYKRQTRAKSKADIIDSVKGWLESDYGSIGRVKMEIAYSKKEKQNYISDYRKMELLYSGQAKDYKMLLATVNSVLVGLYGTIEKEIFISQLLDNLNEVNPKASEQLQNDLDW